MVKYLAVGRLVKDANGKYKEDKHVVIASMLAKKDDPAAKNYKNHCKAIMNKGASKLQPGKRIRLTSDNNDYDLHVIAEVLDEDNDKTIVFFAVTDPEFTKNFPIAKLLQDFKEGIFANCTQSEIAVASSGGNVTRSGEKVMTAVIQKYGSSKLQQVSSKVEEVKGVMKANVQKALDNVEKLEEMEEKSEELEQQGKKFEKGATDVKRMMRCRYYKITCLICLIVSVILIIIIVPIVEKYKN